MLQRFKIVKLLASPHLEPKGLVVAAIGLEMVTQLLTIALHAITANALNAFFIIRIFNLTFKRVFPLFRNTTKVDKILKKNKSL